MLMYGWMKFVEVAPERYDWAVKFMTGGRLDRIKDRIASEVRAGDEVLDIGCGTGTLALRCLRKGARITGLDSNEFMLGEAEKHAKAEGLEDGLRLIHDSVTQLGKYFPEQSFDVVVSTLALGEFPREYLDFILKDCRRILRPGGRLLIADEVLPARPLVRLLYRIGMTLLWIPQFLILRRVFFPIEDLRGTIEAAGFEVQGVEGWAASSLQLVLSAKAAEEPGLHESPGEEASQIALAGSKQGGAAR